MAVGRGTVPRDQCVIRNPIPYRGITRSGSGADIQTVHGGGLPVARRIRPRRGRRSGRTTVWCRRGFGRKRRGRRDRGDHSYRSCDAHQHRTDDNQCVFHSTRPLSLGDHLTPEPSQDAQEMSTRCHTLTRFCGAGSLANPTDGRIRDRHRSDPYAAIAATITMCLPTITAIGATATLGANPSATYR